MLKQAVNGSSTCRVHELGGCLLTVMYVCRSKYAIDLYHLHRPYLACTVRFVYFELLGRTLSAPPCEWIAASNCSACVSDHRFQGGSGQKGEKSTFTTPVVLSTKLPTACEHSAW